MRVSRGLAAAVFACAASMNSQANNGLNLIGYGAEAAAMGGADTAVSRDTTALNANPAGLVQLGRPAFDGYLAAARALDVSHADSLGNDRGVDNRYVGVAGLGLARPGAGGGWAWGVGLFGQGGAGAVYKGLRTPFGTTDELSSQIGFGRVTAGVAWRTSEVLSLGVVLQLNAIVAEQRVFPDTSSADASDPSRNFFGSRIDGARGRRFSLRLGAMWKPAADWTFGATYAPKIAIDATGGRATLNLSAVGLGTVHYRDARIEGFALAREIAWGAAWQVTSGTLVSWKLAHLDWSDALRDLTVTLSDPDSAAAPPVLRQTSAVRWRDQVVLALGVAHELSSRVTAYGGYNVARHPVPRDTMSPLLAAIGTRHATAGLAWRFDDSWVVTTNLEYLFRERVRYRNPSLPVAQPSEERTQYLVWQLMLGRRW